MKLVANFWFECTLRVLTAFVLCVGAVVSPGASTAEANSDQSLARAAANEQTNAAAADYAANMVLSSIEAEALQSAQLGSEVKSVVGHRR